jgi:hypothetical protein
MSDRITPGETPEANAPVGENGPDGNDADDRNERRDRRREVPRQVDAPPKQPVIELAEAPVYRAR